MSNIVWKATNLSPRTEPPEPRGAWTLDETKLLLEVVVEYKATQAENKLDWENLKNKYVKVTEMFLTSYPKHDGKTEFNEISFPNSDDLSYFTKEKIVAKVKRVRANYRKAINSGCKSNGGRTVFALFDVCNKIWGDKLCGTTASYLKPGAIMQSNLDSSLLIGCSDLQSKSGYLNPTLLDTLNNRVDVDENSRLFSQIEDDDDDLDLVSIPLKRCASSAGLMTLEEIQRKKIALETKNKESVKQFEDTMKTFSNDLDNLTTVIDNGFKMLQAAMNTMNPSVGKGIGKKN